MKHKLLPNGEEVKCEMLKELGYTEKTLKEDVVAITEWFEKQPHLAEAGIDPDFVRSFLLMAGGSLERTKQKIDNFYKYRSLAPDLIQSRIEPLTSGKDVWSWFRQAVLSRLYEGRRVTVIQFTDPNPSTFSAEELFRNIFMLLDLRLKYESVRGEIWVIDLKNTTLSHLVRLNPMVIHRASHISQEGLGLKVHAIHVLNFPSFGHSIIDLFRKFIKDKIINRVKIHSSLEELQKALPKRYLPKDYGGEDYSMQEFKVIFPSTISVAHFSHGMAELPYAVFEHLVQVQDLYNRHKENSGHSFRILCKIAPQKLLRENFYDNNPTKFYDMYDQEFRSEQTKKFLMDSCKQVSNEKKRPRAYINEEHLTGSFKKLEFD